MPLSPMQRTRLSFALNRVARKLDKLLERETGTRVGFSLIIWGSFGEDNMIQYVANADREDCVRHMKDLLAGWEAGMPDVPFHERN
ncbi:MAG TPA: hypothetical protein VFA12_20675 [Stellaceae bacterium]|nr:hypothetical protein [Stellaceae bacterium]